MNWYVKDTKVAKVGASFAVAEDASVVGAEVAVELAAHGRSTNGSANNSKGTVVAALAGVAAICVVVAVALGAAVYKRSSASSKDPDVENASAGEWDDDIAMV